MNGDHVGEAAANLAAWHNAALRALGIESTTESVLWSASQDCPSVYYNAITLGGEDAHDEQLASVAALARSHPGDTFAVCDSFGTLDLGELGFAATQHGTWLVRKPGAPERRPFPPELSIERVVSDRQLAAWEAANAIGYGAAPPPEPGTWHAPALLADPRAQIFAGYADGHVVSGSMAYLTDRVNGIYAVFTIPDYRGRGFGEWLAWRAILGRPHQPATLQATAKAEPLYRRMGFEPAGPFTIWQRQPGALPG